MSKIKAVLFDYGMVLSGPPDETAWRHMSVVLNTDADSFNAAYWRYRDRYDRGSLSGVQYWHLVAADLGQSLQDQTLARLLELDTALWTQPNDSMIAWAAKLQGSGVKTGILSNIGDAMETGILARFDWLGHFSHHTFSHRLGIAKPDPAIYQHAVEGLGVPASEILFIDDRAENIQAAQTAGMAAIQYAGHDSFLEAMRSRGYEDLL
jgi:putative hydrolase of the HAD superfamily